MHTWSITTSRVFMTMAIIDIYKGIGYIIQINLRYRKKTSFEFNFATSLIKWQIH